MLVVGHEFITSPKFVKISNKEDIQTTQPNEILYFNYTDAMVDIINFMKKNSLTFATKVDSIRDSIIVLSFNPKYILAEQEMALSIQKYVDNYMFDTKVLQIISNEDEMVQAAKNEIDGVIFNRILE